MSWFTARTMDNISSGIGVRARDQGPYLVHLRVRHAAVRDRSIDGGARPIESRHLLWRGGGGGACSAPEVTELGTAEDVVPQCSLRRSPQSDLVGGTSTQAARVSLSLSMPFVVLGQRDAAIRSSEAQLAAAQIGTRATYADVRAATAHAYVAPWIAEGSATAGAEAEKVAILRARLRRSSFLFPRDIS